CAALNRGAVVPEPIGAARNPNSVDHPARATRRPVLDHLPLKEWDLQSKRGVILQVIATDVEDTSRDIDVALLAIGKRHAALDLLSKWDAEAAVAASRVPAIEGDLQPGLPIKWIREMKPVLPVVQP